MKVIEEMLEVVFDINDEPSGIRIRMLYEPEGDRTWLEIWENSQKVKRIFSPGFPTMQQLAQVTFDLGIIIGEHKRPA